jgi:ABC-type multidrug transport system permease subunit
MAFLTGAFGPTRHYPEVLRVIGDVLPLKYFLDIVDAVYLRGRGIWTEPRALAILGAWAATGLVVGALKFRWEPRER